MNPGCEPVARATRREFLRSMAAGACLPILGGCSTVGGLVESVRTDALVGVIANLDVEWLPSASRFQRALRFFQAVGVDAVVVMGNLTKNGFRNQYETVAEAWRQVFKRERRRVIFVRGERDEAEWREGVDSALRELGETVGPLGGSFDVGGFRFGAAYRRERFDGVPVAFSAHGKRALTDELGYLPRSRRNVYAGSLNGVELQEGFEPDDSLARASQGLLVRAYSSSARIMRLDFSQSGPAKGCLREWTDLPKRIYAETVADDWVVPFEGTPEDPDEPAPRFPKGTRLVLIRGFSGSDNEQVFTVRWPAALTRYGGSRAASYELTVHSGDPQKTRPLYRSYHKSSHWHQKEAREEMSVSTVVYDADIPRGAAVRELTFALTAVSSLGARSETLTAKAIVGGT